VLATLGPKLTASISPRRAPTTSASSGGVPGEDPGVLPGCRTAALHRIEAGSGLTRKPVRELPGLHLRRAIRRGDQILEATPIACSSPATW
jgi:hypothetical protein